MHLKVSHLKVRTLKSHTLSVHLKVCTLKSRLHIHHARLHTHTHARTHARTHDARIHQKRTRTRTPHAHHKHARARAYTHTHIHTHTHTHTHNLLCGQRGRGFPVPTAARTGCTRSPALPVLPEQMCVCTQLDVCVYPTYLLYTKPCTTRAT